MLRALKIAVSLGLLTYLLLTLDWSSAAAAFRDAHIGALALALIIIAGQALTSAWKWRISLAVHQLQWRTSKLLSIILIAFFFNNFLPTAVGGDLYRVYRTLPRNGEKKSRAISALLLDRIVGLLCLLVVGAAGAFVLYLREGSNAMGILAAVLALPPTAAVIMLPLLQLSVLRPLLARIAQVQKLEPLTHNIRLIAGDKRGLLKLAAVSTLFQVLAVAAIAFFFAAVRIFDVIPETAVVSTMYSLASLLPISINGLGVMEGSFAVTAEQLGIDFGHAVVVSLMLRLSTIPLTIAGGIAYLLDNGRAVNAAKVRSAVMPSE